MTVIYINSINSLLNSIVCAKYYIVLLAKEVHSLLRGKQVLNNGANSTMDSEVKFAYTLKIISKSDFHSG